MGSYVLWWHPGVTQRIKNCYKFWVLAVFSWLAHCCLYIQRVYMKTLLQCRWSSPSWGTHTSTPSTAFVRYPMIITKGTKTLATRGNNFARPGNSCSPSAFPKWRRSVWMIVHSDGEASEHTQKWNTSLSSITTRYRRSTSRAILRISPIRLYPPPPQLTHKPSFRPKRALGDLGDS